MRESLLRQRARQADACLAGRDRELEAACVELIEHLARSSEQRDFRIAREIMLAIALGQARILCARQRRRDATQRVGEPETDDKARRSVIRRREI